MSADPVVVPDVTGLPYVQAHQLGSQAGLQVRGVAPDGQPISADSEGLVVEQEPLPGATLKSGKLLLLRVGRPPGGQHDRAPIEPDPLGHEGHGVLPSELPVGSGPMADPDGDPELQPV